MTFVEEIREHIPSIPSNKINLLFSKADGNRQLVFPAKENLKTNVITKNSR